MAAKNLLFWFENGKVCWFGQRAKVGDEYLPAFLFAASCAADAILSL
jgi:hypothetical protein